MTMKADMNNRKKNARYTRITEINQRVKSVKKKYLYCTCVSGMYLIKYCEYRNMAPYTNERVEKSNLLYTKAAPL